MQSLVGVLAGLLVLILTVELLRRRALREKYAVLWLLVSVIGVTFTVFPGVLSWVSSKLGFNLPSNLVFALAALVLLVVGMQLSLEVGRLEDRSQRLAEEIALLRHDLDSLRAGATHSVDGGIEPRETTHGSSTETSGEQSAEQPAEQPAEQSERAPE